MEGYSVTEAASILGVPTERVWELLARGVLAGTSEGEAGMRVYLQPRPAPAQAPIATEAGRSNGNAEAREPERELSPFRELLTEFRNLTERYGQALLALGEARGEVATLRSRVDLLEARMDLRLPMAGFTPPAGSSPWPSSSAERAVASSSEQSADEHGADEGEEDHDRPARRRRSSQRRATESFAEALARAEDPTRSELPGASDVATALAALRDEPGHGTGATSTEAILPRELPVADLMPRAEEERAPEVVVAEPEPVAVEPPEPQPEVIAAEPEPVAVERPEPPPEVVAAEPEPVAAEPAVSAEPEPVAVEPPASEPAAAAAPPEPMVVEHPEPVAEPEPEPAVEAAALEPVTAVQPAPEPESDVVAAVPEPEPEPEVEAAEQEPVRVEPVAEVSPAPDVTPIEEPEVGPAPPVAATAGSVAAPEIEAPLGIEPDDQPAPESVAVAVERELEADDMVGPEPGEPAEPGEPTEPAEPAEPDAVEPITWDRERYTVDIVEPDWFAGEEPQPGRAAARDDAPATEDRALEPDADAARVAPAAAAPVTEPEPPSSAREDEETMLWFGHQPSAPAAGEPADEPTPIDEDADHGADEMEVAGAGHRAGMPGSQELDEALAALDALGRGRVEPASAEPPDEPVDETAAEAWPPADTSAWTSPRPPLQRATPTPASRAYRRLRRIFPG